MRNIGNYELLEKIGTGGMAEVFLARSRCALNAEKLLVAKRILPSLARNEKLVEMFIDEARVVMGLSHSNIVQVYAFDYIDSSLVLIMEYMDGGSLSSLLRNTKQRRRRFSYGLAAYITAEVAKGLDYAHSRNDERGQPLEIIHRDISPQNILLSCQGAVKIADFGISRVRGGCGEDPGSIVGKRGYMSPEQAIGGIVDHRTDIYALGAVLFEMLVGRPLLDTEAMETPRSLLFRASHPAPRDFDPFMPQTLDNIVRRAIAIHPRQRFSDAREMLFTLRRFLHAEAEIYDDDTLGRLISEQISGLNAENGAGHSARMISVFDLEEATRRIVVNRGGKEARGIHRGASLLLDRSQSSR